VKNASSIELGHLMADEDFNEDDIALGGNSNDVKDDYEGKKEILMSKI
jgi:hypothetical protein